VDRDAAHSEPRLLVPAMQAAADWAMSQPGGERFIQTKLDDPSWWGR
jgi:uncharacterized protein (DUF736 family)